MTRHTVCVMGDEVSGRQATALKQIDEALRLLARARERASTGAPNDVMAAAGMLDRAQTYLTMAAKHLRRPGR